MQQNYWPTPQQALGLVLDLAEEEISRREEAPQFYDAEEVMFATNALRTAAAVLRQALGTVA